MSLVNGAFGLHNCLTLGGIDEVIALAVTMLKLASNGGSGTIIARTSVTWCSVVATHSVKKGATEL
eukprot:1015344-Amphidinium_carterae.1